MPESQAVLLDIARQLGRIADQLESSAGTRHNLVQLKIEREKLMIEKLDLHIAKAKRDKDKI